MKVEKRKDDGHLQSINYKKQKADQSEKNNENNNVFFVDLNQRKTVGNVNRSKDNHNTYINKNHNKTSHNNTLLVNNNIVNSNDKHKRTVSAPITSNGMPYLTKYTRTNGTKALINVNHSTKTLNSSYQTPRVIIKSNPKKLLDMSQNQPQPQHCMQHQPQQYQPQHNQTLRHQQQQQPEYPQQQQNLPQQHQQQNQQNPANQEKHHQTNKEKRKVRFSSSATVKQQENVHQRENDISPHQLTELWNNLQISNNNDDFKTKTTDKKNNDLTTKYPTDYDKYASKVTTSDSKLNYDGTNTNARLSYHLTKNGQVVDYGKEKEAFGKTGSTNESDDLNEASSSIDAGNVNKVNIVGEIKNIKETATVRETETVDSNKADSAEETDSFKEVAIVSEASTINEISNMKETGSAMELKAIEEKRTNGIKSLSSKTAATIMIDRIADLQEAPKVKKIIATDRSKLITKKKIDQANTVIIIDEQNSRLVNNCIKN